MRSRTIMERIGMHHDPIDDFDPNYLKVIRLLKHILYRLKAQK